jgi:antitoxin ChpS
MITTKLRKVGGSLMFAVPPALLAMLQLQIGEAVSVKVEDGCLVVEPLGHPCYTLDELLAQCNESLAVSQEERGWIDAMPVGRELL